MFYLYVGGEITIPVPDSANTIRKKVKQMLDEGTLKIGEILEPKQYKRFILRKGEIVEETFTVNGRKYPLLQIRENLLETHNSKGFMRDSSDNHLKKMTKDYMKRQLNQIHEPYDPTSTEEELNDKLQHYMTRRHLLVWQDHSTLVNHGHLLLMVRVMYDPAVYYTPEEMKDITGKEVDIQEIIETPEVYLLAQASDTIIDKLSYIDTRVEDIKELSVKVKASQGEIEITDIMRFFSGDHPEQNSEKGQQEGGEYPCAGCRAKASRFSDIQYCYRQEHDNLEDCRQKVRGMLYSFNISV